MNGSSMCIQLIDERTINCVAKHDEMDGLIILGWRNKEFRVLRAD